MLTAFALLFLTAEPPTIGVMDFQAEAGASADVAQAAATVVAQELERLELFRVSSTQTTRVMLGLERQRELLGCDDCTARSMSDVFDMDFVVTGKLVKAGGEVTLLLSLLAAGNPRPISSARVVAANDAKLLADAPAAAVKLVGKMLEGKQGALMVTASEVGAHVKVDDTQVGTTPLTAPIKLAAGPHLVTVEKGGFTRSQRVVKLVPDQVLEDHFTLVPDPDTIKEYETQANNLRYLAWTSATVALAGAALFGIGQTRADSLYGSATTPNTFLWHQAALVEGRETELLSGGELVNHRAGAAELKTAVQTWQAVSFGALGLAGVATAASVVLFIVGAPPDKYRAFHARLGVSFNGFVLSGGF